MKNILIVSLSLIVIMLIATLLVLGFNTYFNLSTDINTNNVSTSIAAVAFVIAFLWRYVLQR